MALMQLMIYRVFQMPAMEMVFESAIHSKTKSADYPCETAFCPLVEISSSGIVLEPLFRKSFDADENLPV
ncbi:MAG TPA: hypothetical protein VGJ73_05965 [Verrucomicrobiae bacterium]|jgi:hypothetical protein